MPEMEARVDFELDGGALRARIEGEIDHHSARPLREKIDNELCYRRPDKLILDFSGVTFMDSSGLGLLLGRMKTAEELGCGFAVSNPGQRIMKLLELSGADRMFDITREERAAAKTKKGGSQ